MRKRMAYILRSMAYRLDPQPAQVELHIHPVQLSLDPSITTSVGSGREYTW